MDCAVLPPLSGASTLAPTSFDVSFTSLAPEECSHAVAAQIQADYAGYARARTKQLKQISVWVAQCRNLFTFAETGIRNDEHALNKIRAKQQAPADMVRVSFPRDRA